MPALANAVCVSPQEGWFKVCKDVHEAGGHCKARTFEKKWCPGVGWTPPRRPEGLERKVARPLPKQWLHPPRFPG